MSGVYTPREAAQYLRVHVNTVYKLLRAGTLPAARVGRDWRIAEEVLDEYLRGLIPWDRDSGPVETLSPEEAAEVDAAWQAYLDGRDPGVRLEELYPGAKGTKHE